MLPCLSSLVFFFFINCRSYHKTTQKREKVKPVLLLRFLQNPNNNSIDYKKGVSVLPGMAGRTIKLMHQSLKKGLNY